MPLPLILIAIGAGSSIYGGIKGLKALGKKKKAKKINEQAREVFNTAKTNLQSAHNGTSKTLDALGRLKLNVWHRQMGRFVNLFEWLKNVDISGCAQVGELKRIKEELSEIKQISFYASEVVTGGVAAVGAGALAGVAAYGGATMFATASTGTAITTLSGAAAANATLAWFGGGSLATGGLGMAGGMYVLGGIVLGPVLAVGALLFNAKAEQEVAEAESNLAKARHSAAEMKNAEAITRSIQKAATLCHQTIIELRDRVDIVLNNLERILILNLQRAEKPLSQSMLKKTLRFFGIGRVKKIITLAGLSKEGRRIAYDTIPESEQRQIYLAIESIQVLKQLLETPLLNKQGALVHDYQKTIKGSRRFITEKISRSIS